MTDHQTKKLLIVSVTKGYRHEAIPVIAGVLDELAKNSQVLELDYVDTDEDMAAKMPIAALDTYDGVIFNNTTGELPLPDRDGFLKWIASGKAFIGIHSAADTFHGYPPYRQMLGGEFAGHDVQVPVTCLIDDLQFPATEGLGASLDIPLEEIYLFKNFEGANVRLLMHLDKHPNTQVPGLYPMAWCREYGGGRVFYTAFGHREDICTAWWFGKHLLGGILWALGLASGDATPRPLPVIVGALE